MIFSDEQLLQLALKITAIASVQPPYSLSTDLFREVYQQPIVEKPADLALLIDHTVLRPTATKLDIERVLFEARQFGFASACIHSSWLELGQKILEGTDVALCTVVGFPLGAVASEIKTSEILYAQKFSQLKEIDAVLNLGKLKSRDYQGVFQELKDLVQACHSGRILMLKIIIETSLLTDEEKVIASLLCRFAGVDFVKTSTGFSDGGASVADVTLMRRAVGAKIGVKASGGVRNYEQAIAMIEAGATRIGASSGVSILTDQTAEYSY